jgi:PAP2 superfamily/Peptidase propeptide and YPEB domain
MVWSVVISLAAAAALATAAFTLVSLSERAARRIEAVPLVRSVAAGGKAGLSWITARTTSQLLVLAAGTAFAFALALLFVEILDAVVENDDLTALDRPVVQWVAAHRPDWLNSFVVGVTDLGGKVLLTAAVATAAILAARRLRSWWPLLVSLCALGGCALLVAGIKVVIGRDRPDRLHHALFESGFAFPSGHSASALVGWALVAWLVCKLTANRTVRATAWVAAGLLSVAVGASRIYLGVHYPSDVLGGWVLGAVWFTTVLIAAGLDPTVRRPRPRAGTRYDPLIRRLATALSISAIAVLSAAMGIVATLAITGWPRTPAVEGQAAPGPTGPDDARPATGAGVPNVTSAEARRIALDHAGDGRTTEVELEWEHGTLVWSVDVWKDPVEYDVDIDAATGTVISYGPDS